jgi:UDP-glucose 4-epimerase
MKWLITGGCGFIGVNIIERILKNDSSAYIRVVDNLVSGNKKMLANVCDFTEPTAPLSTPQGGVHLYVENICDSAAAYSACKGMDVVIHLAASTGVPVSVKYPRLDMESNVIGTFNYLEGAREGGAKAFIFASTSAASGGYTPPFHEKLFPRPIAPYGASKCAGEAYCHVYHAAYGLNTVALRFSNVYGPHSTNKKAQLIPNFIMGAMEGRTLQIFGDGSQTRDYCYVGDLMDAIMMSVEIAEGIGGNVIQIATNVETSVQEVSDLVVGTLKYYGGISGIKLEYVDERPGDLQRNYSDVSKARQVLGWSNKIAINEGIEETVLWYLKNHQKV